MVGLKRWVGEGGWCSQGVKEATMEANHSHTKQRMRANERVEQSREKKFLLALLFLTVSAEALGEGGGVGDVIG